MRRTGHLTCPAHFFVDKNVESEYLTHVETNFSQLFIGVLDAEADRAFLCAGLAKIALRPNAGTSPGRSYMHTE
jgi:hypothetical protein